jgi:agmatine deiminase
MIIDSQTNFLYLADSITINYLNFFQLFQKAVVECNIPLAYIPKTKDVWAVDYMPIQVTEDKFVQFVYNPDYLQKAKKWRKTIPDVNSICNEMQLQTIKSAIVLDGGNVIRDETKVIMCNKIFKENPSIPEKQLIKELENLFEVDKIIFVPQDPKDEIGHSDGMVRFLDDKTVLINDYSKEDKNFQLDFRTALYNAGLEYMEIPYNPYGNKKNIDATGIYINYLQMHQAVIVPTFSLKEDDTIVKLFEDFFRGQTVMTVPSNEIAMQGGVLNCVTWNIVK